MNRNTVKKFLIKILTKKKPFRSEISDIEKYKYLEEGHIDSLELALFIASIENKFKIKLSPKNLSSKDFRTIKGIINLIQKKLD
tara:strand:+ start:402 stop:653 length:252 start_codon:yes stop_codon:yes gene_type:complete